MNITELCNLRCEFCPRAHDYPNQNLHMSDDVLSEFLHSTEDIYRRHQKNIATFLIGRGEPTLHNDFHSFIEKMYRFKKEQMKRHKFLMHPQVSIIQTNGYKWQNWIPQIGHMFAQIDFNCYPERTYIEYLEIKKEMAQFKNVVVHDRGTTGKNEHPTQTRTNTAGETSKVIYNNRAGSIPDNIIPMHDLDDVKNLPCVKPFDMIYLDWDGEWRLCCNDWYDLISFGNIKDWSINDLLFHNDRFNEYRWRLMNGDRSLQVCNKCNQKFNDDGWYGWWKRIKIKHNNGKNPAWIDATKKRVDLKNKFVYDIFE